MLSFRPVFFINGLFLIFFAFLMLIPAIIDFNDGGTEWKSFMFSSFFTFFFGIVFFVLNIVNRHQLSLKQAFLLTIIIWCSISICGSLPLFLSSMDISYIDALFESVSAITTTGATVLIGLDAFPRSILLWRSLMQWLGGIGVIVLALAILPWLNVSGNRLFQLESSEATGDKVRMQARDFSFVMGGVYIALTMLCVICLVLVGVKPFDAILHAMTTVATAGFSTKDTSIAWFNNYNMEIVIVIFMLLSSLPYMLYYKMISNVNILTIIQDSQVRFFLSFLLIAFSVSLFWVFFYEAYSLKDAFRYVLFNVVSIITTTGFSSHDYSIWSSFIIFLFFLLACVGGCSGSTSGGIKIFRIQILYKTLSLQIKRLLEPNGVFKLQYNSKIISNNTIDSVSNFFILFLVLFSIVSLLLAITGLDLITSASSAMAALTNLGPGFGDMVGPSGNYKNIGLFAKMIMIFAMIAGRLEIFAVLMMFTRKFWQH